MYFQMSYYVFLNDLSELWLLDVFHRCACVRASVYLSACVQVRAFACARPCVRTCVCVRVRACERVCWR